MVLVLDDLVVVQSSNELIVRQVARVGGTPLRTIK